MSIRRGNVIRLPMPPPIAKEADEGVRALHEHVRQITDLLNQSLQNVQLRLNTIQQQGAKTPPTVTGLTVTGKQGLFYLTWNRIANTDGYVVVQASDTGMTQLVGRYNLPDGQTCSYSIPVGNVAVTNTFQVYAYQGSKYSSPSPAVTATTVAYGAGESAPAAPPIAPQQPKLAPVRSGPNL